MQPSPSFSIQLKHSGAWRLAIAAAALCTLVGLWRWCLSSPEPVAGAVGWAVTLSAGVFVGALGLLLPLQPAALRWDGQRWYLGPLASPGREPCSGQLTVSIDLGSWMLLRFCLESPGPGRRVTWLPVHRWGIEAQWHALRCAVYSPRPADDDSAEAAP